MSAVPNLPPQSAACGQAASSASAKAQPTASAAVRSQTASDADTPLAFRALIERLRDQARVLEHSAAQPIEARELSGAVQAAQASLNDALSIADGLVEAYRSSRIQTSSTPSDPAR